MSLDIIQISVLSDNYVYILRDPVSKMVGVIDPAEAEPVISYLDSKQWTLNYILNTHHHGDHVGGNRKLVDRYGAEVLGAKTDAKRIPLIQREYKQGDRFHFGEHVVDVIDVSGHTLGHIAYFFPDDKALFCGDSLFSLGCGRMFEGTADVMWEGLTKLT